VTIILLTIGLSVTGKKPVSANRFRKINGFNIPSLKRIADLHMSQLMPLPLIVSCLSKIQIGFTFLVLAYPSSPGNKGPLNKCVFLYIGYSVPYLRQLVFATM